MSKYLLPVCYPGKYPSILNVNARTMEEAETKFINLITFESDLDIAGDWNEFLEITYKADVLIGEISSIEEFE